MLGEVGVGGCVLPTEACECGEKVFVYFFIRSGGQEGSERSIPTPWVGAGEGSQHWRHQSSLFLKDKRFVM